MVIVFMANCNPNNLPTYEIQKQYLQLIVFQFVLIKTVEK